MWLLTMPSVATYYFRNYTTTSRSDSTRYTPYSSPFTYYLQYYSRLTLKALPLWRCLLCRAWLLSTHYFLLTTSYLEGTTALEAMALTDDKKVGEEVENVRPPHLVRVRGRGRVGVRVRVKARVRVRVRVRVGVTARVRARA